MATAALFGNWWQKGRADFATPVNFLAGPKEGWES